MEKAELLERIEKAKAYLAQTDLTQEQRERAEKRRDELVEQVKILQNSDERAIRAINAIREMLKIKPKDEQRSG